MQVIYIFCRYVPRDPSISSETFHYKRGANQQFCQMNHVFDPSRYSEDELLYDIDRELIPIAIHCVAEEGPEGRSSVLSKQFLVINRNKGLFLVTVFVGPTYCNM